MTDPNYNNIYTVIGARSQGKTPFILGGKYEKGLANIFMKEKNMSVLIIDEMDHPKYRHVPFLHPNNYSKLSNTVGIYRTLATIDKMPMLMERLKNVWNTLIVFEDCHKYFDRKFTRHEIAILGNSKNQNNDLVFMHWCFGFTQKDLFRMTNYFILFKTGDSPDSRKDDIKGYTNAMYSAYNKIQQRPKDFNGLPYIVIETGI